MELSPELTSWVNELGLSVIDKNTLVSGKWLTANHMSAANYLLKTKYLCQNGLQDTCALVQKWYRKAGGSPILIVLYRSYT